VNTVKATTLRAQAQELLDRADVIDAIAEPTAADGEHPIIQWEETFGGDTTYTYAAVKVADLWYVTGRHPATGLTWAQMVDRYYGIRHETFWTAEQWTRRS
jgi:hypothetical protein